MLRHSTFDRIPSLNRPLVCAMGVFDGLHLGHQRVIGKTLELAQSLDAAAGVLTFQNHPSSILRPEQSPAMIYPNAVRQQLFQSLGLDFAWMIPFGPELSALDASQFAQLMAKHASPLVGVVAGDTFRFGHQRKGDLKLLSHCLNQLSHRAQVIGVPQLEHNDEIMSSTRIRQLIANGQLKEAGELLGRTYLLHGTVVRGDGLGRQLGFPTANLDTSGLVTPPGGVYAIYGQTASSRFGGVMNIGWRPTLQKGEKSLRVEAHFPGVEVDLYGQALSIQFNAKIRDESRFPSLDALKTQIEKDVQAAHHINASID